MSRSLKVKAVLQTEGVGGSSPEIRRFTVCVDSGADSDLYNRLLTTVRSVFNISNQAGHCTLLWKDEDDDLVEFSSLEELCHAMDNMSDDTLRIYVSFAPDVNEEIMEPFSDSEEDGTTRRRVTFQPHLQSTGPPHPHPHPRAWMWKGRGAPFMGPGMHWGRKGKMMKKMMKKMMRKQSMMATDNKEFNTIRQQVPAEFRTWVRQYVRTWFQQGAEAAAALTSVPEGAPQGFPQWLATFLDHWTTAHPGQTSTGSDGETGMEEEGQEEMLAPPEGLQPVYYQWICLFVRRFTLRHANVAASEDSEGDEGLQCPGKHWRHHGHGLRHGRGPRHGCHQRHGGRHGKRGGKHGGHSSSSESEDSDCGKKPWQKVPKEFRKYVRVSMKQLLDKGDNPKAKEKATQAGLSPEVLEFVQQTLLEWHEKLSHKRPCAVAKEMIEGERTLPSGLQREHFLWLCRFITRWHRRHAAKCDVMSGWSSGETTDDTSGDESRPLGDGGLGPWPQFRGNRRHFRAAMTAMHGHPHGMMEHPPFHFAMHPGMGHPCTPTPLPPPFHVMHGCTTPVNMMGYGVLSPDDLAGCGGKRGHKTGRPRDCKRRKDQDGAASGQPSTSHDDVVERVTEGVKRM